MHDPLHARIRPELHCFCPTELAAMWRAGDLDRFGIPGFEFYLPAGVVPTPLDRARSLGAIARTGRILTGMTAHWIHHGGRAPARIEVSRRTGSRPRELDASVEWRYRRIHPGDVVEIGPIRLTTIERTRADLLRRAGGER